MANFEFTSKVKSSVLQIDGGNQIPINGFYLPVVLMPENIKIGFRPLNNIEGLTQIQTINISVDTININSVLFEGATATELKDALQAIFFLDESDSSSSSNWGQWKDTLFTDVNKLTITGGTRVKIPNNGLSVIDTYMKSDVSFYDAATQKITPETLGDTYEMRLSFCSDSSTNQNYAGIDLDIGGSLGKISENTITFPRGQGIEHCFSITTSIFSLGTFIANGGELFISPNNNIDIWDVTLLIIKN